MVLVYNGIYTNIKGVYNLLMVNVTIYSIHGSYGYRFSGNNIKSLMYLINIDKHVWVPEKLVLIAFLGSIMWKDVKGINGGSPKRSRKLTLWQGTCRDVEPGVPVPLNHLEKISWILLCPTLVQNQNLRTDMDLMTYTLSTAIVLNQGAPTCCWWPSANIPPVGSGTRPHLAFHNWGSSRCPRGPRERFCQ